VAPAHRPHLRRGHASSRCPRTSRA
jgi:hypothetical protein